MVMSDKRPKINWTFDKFLITVFLLKKKVNYLMISDKKADPKTKL